MKKLITFVAVLAMLIPLSAMAMTPVADSELAEVTGQVGIDIAVVDFHMDMSIGNVAWGDTDGTADSGAMYVANHATDYTDGYININNIVMDDIFVTLNANPSFTASPAHLLYADPLKIDVATLGAANVASQVFAGLAGKTAIVITMGDMHLQVGKISVGGIYLADEAYSGTYSFAGATDEFVCTANANMVDTENLGVLEISCVDIVTYSSVDGYTAGTNAKANGNNPSRVYILAH